MKYVNQKDYPGKIYKTGLKLDYEYYLANKERIDASNFGPLRFTEGMPALANNANIAQAGCGLCCAVMAADMLVPNSTFSLDDALEISYLSGGNTGIGTEYDPFAPEFAKKMGLNWKGTNDLKELDYYLAHGGVAVAKAGGDRKDGHIGVFTHGWHYILITHKTTDEDGGRYAILDPSLVYGKYDEEGRKGLVEVNGMYIYASPEVVKEEVKLFDPGFYIFWTK